MEAAKKVWAWALGSRLLRLGRQAGRRAGRAAGWVAVEGSGRLEASKHTRGTCGHVRLGGLGRFQWGSPLRVSPGKANCETCTRQPALGALKGTFHHLSIGPVYA